MNNLMNFSGIIVYLILAALVVAFINVIIISIEPNFFGWCDNSPGFLHPTICQASVLGPLLIPFELFLLIGSYIFLRIIISKFSKLMKG